MYSAFYIITFPCRQSLCLLEVPFLMFKLHLGKTFLAVIFSIANRLFLQPSWDFAHFPSFPGFPGNFSGFYNSQFSQLSREFPGKIKGPAIPAFPGSYESQLSRDFPGISAYIFNANESQLSGEFYSFPRLLNFPGNPGFNPRKIPGISRECPSFFRTGSG